MKLLNVIYIWQIQLHLRAQSKQDPTHFYTPGIEILQL